ncbi:hypothetical protein BH10ACT3_BH10ACT3_10400 [soil metagenome]
MNMRRTTGALMIAALVLLGACSSDSKSDASDSKKTTTTEAGATTTAKPLTDEEYSASIKETTDAIAGAGTDLCAVSEGIGEGPPPPANTAQVKEAVDFYATLLNAFAHALPAENAAQTQALETAATDLKTEAETAGYPADFFGGDTGPATLAGQDFTNAMGEVQTIYSTQCEPAATTTTAP